MSWEETQLGDLGKIVTGKTPVTKNPDFYGGEYMFVTPSDFDFRNYYCQHTEHTVTEKAENAHKNQFIPPDSVMFTCIGNTIGKCAISSEYCLTNQQINSVLPKQGIDPHFLYYLLENQRDRIRGIGLSSGSAQPIINKTTFSKLRVLVPDISIQNKISNILRPYDDLIENNCRRIQLLEESARLLYREWFIHLRFPAHEHVKVVNGVPEGWDVRPLAEVADITMGQSPKSEFYNQDGDGLPFHQGASDFGERFVNHRVYTTVKNRVANPGDILCTVRAPVGRLNMTLDQIVVGRGLSAIREKHGRQSHLYYQLKQHFFREDLFGTGAIFAGINKKELAQQKLVRPPDKLINEFEEYVQPIDQQIATLTKQNQKLAEARDLLLPRLLNGEIAV